MIIFIFILKSNQTHTKEKTNIFLNLKIFYSCDYFKVYSLRGYVYIYIYIKKERDSELNIFFLNF